MLTKFKNILARINPNWSGQQKRNTKPRDRTTEMTEPEEWNKKDAREASMRGLGHCEGAHKGAAAVGGRE